MVGFISRVVFVLVLAFFLSACASDGGAGRRQAGSNSDPCSNIDIKKNRDERNRCYQEQIASLQKELDRKLALYQAKSRERARTKIISSSETEYPYKNYMDHWGEKVERIGNLNYPEEARRNHLHGNVILDVRIAADGSLMSVEVRKSSGFPVLDKAAVDVVRLASPFAPFPSEIRDKYDILEIVKTFRFVQGNRK